MALKIFFKIWISLCVLWTVAVPVRLQEVASEDETTSSAIEEEETILAVPAQEDGYSPQETTTSMYGLGNEYQTQSTEYQTSYPSEYQPNQGNTNQGYDSEYTTTDPMQNHEEFDYEESTNTYPTAYSNSWSAGQKTTTKKSRWSSNRNNRRNKYDPNANKNYGKRYPSQPDKRNKQPAGDGILSALSRSEKWNRNGMVKSD